MYISSKYFVQRYIDYLLMYWKLYHTTLINFSGVNSRNGFKAKKFLVKNKTAPTLEDDTNNTVNDIEYFHSEIEDRVAFLPLDPINLKSQNFNKTFIPQMRPFTAPATSQRPDVFVMPNLPGQVFQ